MQSIEAADGQAISAPGNVADPADTDRVFATAEERAGGLDILVNNAGVTRDASLHGMTDEHWRIVHEVVLWDSFCMSCAAARRLQGRPRVTARTPP